MNCPFKFFKNVEGDCQKCSYGCQTCLSQVSCQICEPYFTLLNDECKSEDSSLSVVGPIIALAIFLTFIFGFLFVIWYSKYLERKRERRKKEDILMVNLPERLTKKFSEEKIHKVTLNDEVETQDYCLFCRKDGVNTETKCHHKFHWKCIEAWLTFSSCCPVCKTTEVLPLITLTGPLSYFEENQISQEESEKAIVIPNIGSYGVLNEESPVKIK